MPVASVGLHGALTRGTPVLYLVRTAERHHGRTSTDEHAGHTYLCVLRRYGSRLLPVPTTPVVQISYQLVSDSIESPLSYSIDL